jgi:hypothetical protein
MKDNPKYRLLQDYYDVNWNVATNEVKTGDNRELMTQLFEKLKRRYTIRTLRFYLVDRDDRVLKEYTP